MNSFCTPKYINIEVGWPSPLAIEGREMLWPIEAETGPLEGSWKVSQAS